MNTQKSNRPLAWLFLTISILVFGTVLYLVMDFSQADDVSQTVDIQNATPSIDSVVISATSQGGAAATLTTAENSQATYYIYGTASDANGCSEIDDNTTNWAIALYRSGATGGFGCTADSNDCYLMDTTNDLTISGCSGGADQDLAFEGTVTIDYWIDPTDAGAPLAAQNWVAEAEATDDNAANASDTTTTEVTSLLSLNATATIDYGTIAQGAESSEQTVTFTNTGNRAIDADQSADGDMSCSGQGSIPVDQVEFSLTQGFTYGAGQDALQASTNFDLSLPQRTSEVTASTDDAYFILEAPPVEADTVSGTCTNTLTFTAKADA
jgi:hypothetical protein